MLAYDEVMNYSVYDSGCENSCPHKYVMGGCIIEADTYAMMFLLYLNEKLK